MQRSAAGEAYAQHEAQARVTASVLSGQTHGGMVVRPRGPRRRPATPARWRRWSRRTSASRPTEGKTTRHRRRPTTADLAWAVGSWAVARATDTGATRVVVGDREWRRGMQDSALEWHTVDAAAGTDATTVTIHLT